MCIIVAQDLRLYEIYQAQIPDFNRFLDCGAAVENMLLAAHGLGLGAVWLTFERGEAGALHKELDLPEHISLTTYIALGWPGQVKLPTGRIRVEIVDRPGACSSLRFSHAAQQGGCFTHGRFQQCF